MKWIIIVIILFMGGYTYVTLKYRKPNKAYEPFNDLKERGQTHNLLTTGYQRITLTADQPTHPPPIAQLTTVGAAPGGLPPTLRESLFDPPQLPETILKVEAAGETSALLAYPILFTCSLSHQRQQLSDAHLYLRQESIIIVPEFAGLKGELLARDLTQAVRLVIPGGALKPGRYQVVLAGAKSSLGWTLQVH